MHISTNVLVDRITTALMAGDYKQSNFTGSLFHEASDKLHKTFCVQAVSSEVQSFDDRGNWQATASWHGEFRTTLEVEVLFKLRIDAHNTDYSTRLGEETDFIRALLAVDRGGIKLFPNNVTRSLTNDRQFLSIKLSLTAYHRFAYGD